ncbi:MAG: hypothetical protein KJ645_02295 [Planctomycetes bacterium]|nr:hypothetical protein [Planctomycetota bacterium]
MYILKSITIVMLIMVTLNAITPEPLCANPRSDKDHQELAFAKWADAFAKWAGVPEIPRQRGALEHALNSGHLMLRLGIFDLWYPRRFLKKKSEEKIFKKIGLAVIDMQKEWVAWSAKPESMSGIDQEIKILEKWVNVLNIGQTLSWKNETGITPDLIEIKPPSEKICRASKTFSQFMTEGISLGRNDSEKKNIQIVFAPTREEFLGLGSFIGSISELRQEALWREDLVYWTTLNWEPFHVIALEHPLNKLGEGDITTGLAMDEDEKTGMLEHVVQYAMERLLIYYYSGSIHPDQVKGLAINMVIELYGQNNVRAGGGSGGLKTAGRSVFVAGASGDGKLPAGYASRFLSGRWRAMKGKDHFLKSLQIAQKNGIKAAKSAENRDPNTGTIFALEPETGLVDPHLVQAPFLDRFKPKPTVPPSYKDDYLEFLRAYRSGFTYWLQYKAHGSADKKRSQELFQDLLHRIGRSSGPSANKKFEDLVLEVYGKPMVPDQECRESLEGDFVVWLANGG